MAIRFMSDFAELEEIKKSAKRLRELKARPNRRQRRSEAIERTHKGRRRLRDKPVTLVR